MNNNKNFLKKKREAPGERGSSTQRLGNVGNGGSEGRSTAFHRTLRRTPFFLITNASLTKVLIESLHDFSLLTNHVEKKAILRNFKHLFPLRNTT